MNFLKQVFGFFVFACSGSPLYPHFRAVRSAAEFQREIFSLQIKGLISPENTVIFFDLDQTIIEDYYRGGYSLTDNDWPDVINMLNRQDYITAGLSSASGIISDVQVRVAWLQRLGIQFAASATVPSWWNIYQSVFSFGPEVTIDQSSIILTYSHGQKNSFLKLQKGREIISCSRCLNYQSFSPCRIAPFGDRPYLKASYVKGLIQTDHLAKGFVLEHFFCQDTEHPKNIVFIDNLKSCCKDVINYCKKVKATRSDSNIRCYVYFFNPELHFVSKQFYKYFSLL